MSPRWNLHVIRGKISQSKCHPPPAVLGWALMAQRPISVKWSSMQGLSKGQNNFHLRIWYGERRKWENCAASLGFDAHRPTQLVNKCQNRKIKQWLSLCFQSRFILFFYYENSRWIWKWLAHEVFKNLTDVTYNIARGWNSHIHTPVRILSTFSRLPLSPSLPQSVKTPVSVINF